MATYMVEINNRFVVRLEHDGSACGAEHYFLDNFKGVWGALAFDRKSMKTDCFIGVMMNDELTTVDALSEKLMRLDEEAEELESLSDQIKTIDDEIARLAKERERLSADRQIVSEHHQKMRERLNADRPM